MTHSENIVIAHASKKHTGHVRINLLQKAVTNKKYQDRYTNGRIEQWKLKTVNILMIGL